jgi:hypothetical protein
LKIPGKVLRSFIERGAVRQEQTPANPVSVAFLLRPKLQQRLKRSLLGAVSGIAIGVGVLLNG